MKKRIIILFSLLMSLSVITAEQKAKDIALESCKQATIKDSISYLNSKLSSLTVPSEKRAIYVFLASLQEQQGLYDQAQKNYATAAGISAKDAEGMPSKSNEQLVIDAVRCALCAGDFQTADSYLSSSVKNSKNSEISSYYKLYSQWSSLCRAESSDDLVEPVELLKAYATIPSMKNLQPVILLTLWYITGDGSYSSKIISDYPNSVESAIVKGDVQLLPVPFWYFVPKTGVAEQGTGSYVSKVESTSDKTPSSTAAKFSKWQLGLFKSSANAKALCEEVKSKGFDAFVTSETRSSGTTYYIVLVNDDKTGTTSDKLRSAGYECYPVD